MENLKLIITDKGDPSVGIIEISWVVEVPFYIDPKNLSIDDKENLDFFRNKIRKVYSEFCDGRISLDYDFELKNLDNG